MPLPSPIDDTVVASSHHSRTPSHASKPQFTAARRKSGRCCLETCMPCQSDTSGQHEAPVAAHGCTHGMDGRVMIIATHGDYRQHPCHTTFTIFRCFPCSGAAAALDCGSLRQSGPRPDPRLLRQAALEALTRSARTNTPQKLGRNNFRRSLSAAARGAAAAAGVERREAACLGA
ncbi:hypothetical protein F511_19748 [Dorcoceras hygrometricum]|uniref:Uncharacterized protein n=1 Tax=Dorcoceras hygrometricum TaxID=472368 RepID=A0A2Z7B7I7_9LAMI|nr:hypothetical protein F511_19748 [Dorcoceras hygrometricum]